jgi:hypothetical protein
MGIRRMAAFQAGLLLMAMFANAESGDGKTRIKVLDSETRSVSLGGNDVPKNCDQVNFDAYCNNSRTAVVTHILLVQEGNGAPFHISCTMDTKYSSCAPLAKGESFDARREKHGLVVYYQNDRGKARKQLYTLVDPETPSAASATQPVPEAAAPRQSPPAPATPPPVAAQQTSPDKVSEKVKCHFSSIPPGAEINVDGKYVGSTPSEIPLGTGTHVVVISTPGFAQWKRELTVLPGAELTVSAILQKEQP